MTTLERAVINPDGTLGAFVPLTAGLNRTRFTSAATRIGKYLYVFGGYTTDTIERAEVFADGSIGRFELLNRILPETRAVTGPPVVVGNYLYLVGGDAGGLTNTVLMAPLFPDGTLGDFTRAPSLVTPVAGGTSTRIGNYLYCFGGYPAASTATTLVQRALIKPDGTLNAWEAYRPGGRDVLPIAITHHNTAPYVYGNRLYIFSGWTAIQGFNVDATMTGTMR